MKWKLIVFLGLLPSYTIAFAQAYPKAWLCAAGCRRAVDKTVFDVPKAVKNKCHPLYARSLFACIAQYCTRHQTNVGLPSINETYCSSHGSPLPPYDFTAARQLLSDNVTWVSYPEVRHGNYTTQVVPDQKFYQLAYDTENASNTATTFDWALAMSNIGFWALVLLIAASLHQLSLLRESARKSPVFDGTKSPASKKTGSWLQRNLLVASALPHSSAMVPNRLEALLVLAYILMNFVFCFLGYNYMKVSLLDWHAVQYERFIGNRCGFLVLSNFPLVWLFASKNNPFIWLTHWSFDTFNFFHRWIARLTVVLALVHAICYTTGDSKQGIYIRSWKRDLWYRCGIFGLITMSFMVFLSSRYFRRRAYDLFLALHIGMAAAILILIKKHLSLWKGNTRRDLWAFIWTCVAFWAIDRLVRFFKIFYTMLRTGGRRIKTTATFDQDAGIIRLDVSSLFHKQSVPRPGAYYHIYEPKQWRGYENHPFSLCSWSESPTPPSTILALEDEKHKSEPTVMDVTEDASTDSRTATSGAERKVSRKQTFLIRPQAGWTQRLAKKLSSSGINSTQLTLLYEGPYGQQITLNRHSDTLMILGGSGITAAISHISQLIETSPHHRTIRILWVARTWSFCHAILQNELAYILQSHHDTHKIQLEIYLTADDEKLPPAPSATANYKVFAGRPDIEKAIFESRDNAARDLGVFCCGPTSMGLACRDAVGRVLKDNGQQQGNKDLRLYYESFSW